MSPDCRGCTIASASCSITSGIQVVDSDELCPHLLSEQARVVLELSGRHGPDVGAVAVLRRRADAGDGNAARELVELLREQES